MMKAPLPAGSTAPCHAASNPLPANQIKRSIEITREELKAIADGVIATCPALGGCDPYNQPVGRVVNEGGVQEQEHFARSYWATEQHLSEPRLGSPDVSGTQASFY